MRSITESTMQILAGKVLKSVSRGHCEKIPEDSYAYGGVHQQNTETVTFHCEDGDYVFLADGDCCSHTFVESIDGPTAGKILSVEEPECQIEGERGDSVTARYRSTLLIEGAGRLDVEYRNESNGYYGGSMTLLSGPDKTS